MKSDSSSTVILSIASSRSSCVLMAITCSSSLVWCRSAAASAAGLGFLVANLGERVAEVPDIGCEQRREGRGGRLDRAGELAQQDLARRQGREARHAGCVDAAV